jgi:hypothetical protein
MLEVATMTDPALNQGAGRRGQDPDHRQSLQRDSASNSSTFVLGHDRSWEEGDLQDVIHTKDVRGRIDSRHQYRDRVEREHHNKRDYDLYDP